MCKRSAVSHNPRIWAHPDAAQDLGCVGCCGIERQRRVAELPQFARPGQEDAHVIAQLQASRVPVSMLPFMPGLNVGVKSPVA